MYAGNPKNNELLLTTLSKSFSSRACKKQWAIKSSFKKCTALVSLLENIVRAERVKS